jgi:hypothetical protein
MRVVNDASLMAKGGRGGCRTREAPDQCLCAIDDVRVMTVLRYIACLIVVCMQAARQHEGAIAAQQAAVKEGIKAVLQHYSQVALQLEKTEQAKGSHENGALADSGEGAPSKTLHGG